MRRYDNEDNNELLLFRKIRNCDINIIFNRLLPSKYYLLLLLLLILSVKNQNRN